MEKEAPLVSVWMTTYNHERYIAQAIESVLMQKTSFPFELLIGEDCSTDNTGKICKDYAERHPGVIRLFSRAKNLGMIQNGLATLSEAKGKYVAILEGDDFWIDPLKLQKQVDFLESNPDFSLCFHNAYEIDGQEEGLPYSKIFRHYEKDVFSLPDLFKSWFIPTASVVFRRSAVIDLPDWYSSAPVGDTPFFVLVASKGKLKLVEGIMSAYRHHPGGVTKAINFLFWQRMVDMYRSIDEYFSGKYHRQIQMRRKDMWYFVTQESLKKSDFKGLRKATIELLKMCLKTKTIERKEIIVSAVAAFPNLYLAYKRFAIKARKI